MPTPCCIYPLCMDICACIYIYTCMFTCMYVFAACIRLADFHILMYINYSMSREMLDLGNKGAGPLL